MKARARRGFTLLEIIVVVLIIGILAAFAVPYYRQSMENSMADSAKSLLETIGTMNRIYAEEKGALVRNAIDNNNALVTGKYVAPQDWGRLAYDFDGADVGFPCFVARAKRKNYGDYGTTTSPYSERLFCIDGVGKIVERGQSVACGTCRMPACLTAGTLIETPRGSKAIEALAVGDVVYSVDPATRRRVEAAVADTFERLAEETVIIALVGRARRLRATDEHPFFDPRSGAFKPLKEFKAGDELLVYEGEAKPAPRAIERLERVKQPQRVFNLTIGGDFHNYIADGVLVHNKFAMGP